MTDRPPVGLYVHVPFCARKCGYCDFVSFPGREGDVLRYRDALIAELGLRRPLPPIDTVFFGGGTPSLPLPAFVPSVLAAARAETVVAGDAEITCEANPGSLTAGHVAAWRAAGVNRLSLGAQAAQDHLLEALGRIHCWHDVEEAAALWGEADSLSLDLMYGLPGQTMADWRETLAAAVALGPGHLSCYSLIVEEDTPFGRRMERGELHLPAEEEERAMHRAAAEALAAAGYAQYEISNWARDGRVCLHNLHTWRRREYVGIGCAAASFLGGARTRNLCDLDGYMEAVERGALPVAETDVLTPEDALFEEVMLGLRLTGGVELSPEAHARYGGRLAALPGLVKAEGRRIRLTPRGVDIMNAVLRSVMEE